uniref:M23ase beta-sheet core domain-containing protein n=1 Tax=viral metagenome TaxID=1070528 RepID=A0A2V0RIV7_9ZZZZ
MINFILLSSLAASPNLPLTDMLIRGNSVSNTFGMVRNSGKRAHQGWDLSARVGQPVYAIAPFNTTSSGYHADYGYWIQYTSTVSGYIYFNAHLSKFLDLPDGGKAGDVIGYCGNSGNARNTDTHLHFEMREVSNPGLGLSGRVSPAKTFGSWTLYLTNPEGK